MVCFVCSLVLVSPTMVILVYVRTEEWVLRREPAVCVRGTWGLVALLECAWQGAGAFTPHVSTWRPLFQRRVLEGWHQARRACLPEF